jgi:uncharacterized integral membrane protein (TIGR00698 family)|tara:strand:- start:15217 stop:16269 length:1053 start_codon:yes stop_codon:yes gene_type:complete
MLHKERLMNWFKPDPERISLGYGLLFCIALAVGAEALYFLEKSVFDFSLFDSLVIVIVIAVLIRNLLPLPQKILPGSSFASKQILETAVLMLGASVNLFKIVDAGASMLLIIIFSVCGGLFIAWFVGHKILKLGSRLALLVGAGNSICGNSAVAAVAPAIGASSTEIAAAISISAILGVVQILFLPLLAPTLNLTNYEYGVIAGLSVYAVSQVVAASFIISNLSGHIATLVKLIRVLLLGPMIIVLGVIHSSTETQQTYWEKIKVYVPWFVVGFIILAVLRTTGLIPEYIGDRVQIISKFLFVIAMAGLGLGVNLREIVNVGPRVALTTTATTGFMLMCALFAVTFLELG